MFSVAADYNYQLEMIISSMSLAMPDDPLMINVSSRYFIILIGVFCYCSRQRRLGQCAIHRGRPQKSIKNEIQTDHHCNCVAE